jgi:hypothetical protein
MVAIFTLPTPMCCVLFVFVSSVCIEHGLPRVALTFCQVNSTRLDTTLNHTGAQQQFVLTSTWFLIIG